MERGQAKGPIAFRRVPRQAAASAVIALALVACGGGVAPDPGATAASRHKAAAAPVGTIAQRYTVVNLASNGSVRYGPGMRPINASGQVAFTALGLPGRIRAMTFDGTDVHEVGPPGSPAITSVTGISDAGEVFGAYSYDDGNQGSYWTPFAWADGIFHYPPLPSDSSALLLAVSGSGQAVLSLGSRGADQRIWNRADDALFGTSGFASTWASPRAINDAGTVVGMSGLPSGQTGTLAFVWTPGASPDVQYVHTPLPGEADFINNQGQVAGMYGYGARAFRWNPGDASATDLNVPAGARLSGLDDAGRIVGTSRDLVNSSSPRAFIWSPDGAGGGSAVEVGLGGDSSAALAINNAGLTVGWANATPAGALAAFAWTASQGTVDLNTRIPEAAAVGVHLDAAYAVSDNGSIVALANTGLVLLRPDRALNPPTVGPISAADPVAVNTALSFTAGFSDADTGDTHSAVWTWGDGSATTTAVITESNGSGTASASHTFSAAGVYTVSVEVSDNTGKSASVSREVVVYDPAAGFVTGGGWIDSPAGAYKQDLALAGRASFAFVSKYQKGAHTPSGNTGFQFHSANLNFHSNTYDWLVVAGARAQYKGEGTLNGQGQYKFLLTAVDGAKLGGNAPDRFRIKIWPADDDSALVYDNQLDGATEGTVNEGTGVSSGSIVVQSK